MKQHSSHSAIAASLVFAVFLWGGNNAGVKYLVGSWPPIMTGCTRFFCAGLLLLGVLRWRRSSGVNRLTAEQNRQLWLRGGLSLAVYIVAFNWALHFTSASHVALYLGASPVWALLGEREKGWKTVPRYIAALVAFSGILILFWPALKLSSHHWIGEALGLAASVLWAYHGHQCRALGGRLNGMELSAHNMWRASCWLAPLALLEVTLRPAPLRMDLLAIQCYCILFGGVIAFALWNNALAQWTTGRVFLFNNLIPLSTMAWAHFCLREPVSRNFFLAMTMIVGAVLLGRIEWKAPSGAMSLPPD
jgi:drug/metabolite transporter (DMT)-like permease